MSETVQVIRVFLASPGDLGEERGAVKKAADEINTLLARPMGFQIDLIGWEDTISAAGRPQSIINEDLKTCEFFIGMIWAKWGTPPDTEGQFGSGFEEEFSLAQSRRSEFGHPEMSMFFKEVAEAQKNDPGDELKKVIEFREKLISEKALLFDNFSNADELAEKIRACLSSYIHKLHKAANTMAEVADESQAILVGQPIQPIAITTENEILASHDSIFLKEAGDKFEGGNPYEQVSPADLARLRLIAASVSFVGNDEVLIGPHDGNLIYKNRTNFQFDGREIRALAVAGLRAISHQNLPFWSWLALCNPSDADWLNVTSSFGPESTRVAAFTAMRMLKLPLPPNADDGTNIFLDRWLGADTPDSPKDAALQYLGELGTNTELEMVKGELEKARSGTVRSALEATVSIMLRYRRTDATELVIKTSFDQIDNALLVSALSGLLELPDETLILGLEHRNAAVRTATLT